MRHQEPIITAYEQAEVFLRDGADILDVGGESTRPGAKPVNEEEEIERVVPVIEKIRERFPDVPISIDTYKPNVARKALEAGASWVNDIWGFHANPELAEVVAEFNVPVILMHNRLQTGTAVHEAHLGGRYVGTKYDDLIGEICRDLMESVCLAHKVGIPDEHIILDPGIGFGKSVQQNLVLINKLDSFKALRYPILVGPSRKSFIGYTLDLPPDERIEGTTAAVAICIDRGADIVRVHDVRIMTRVARMTDAIVRYNELNQ
jgi:dihydropteroate synthase